MKITAVKTVTERIHTEFIKLDSLLKFAALAESGGEAKQLVVEGGVRVNGEICTQRGRKIYPGDTVSVPSRGVKLAVERALQDEL